jgi:hypothetical protein
VKWREEGVEVERVKREKGRRGEGEKGRRGKEGIGGTGGRGRRATSRKAARMTAGAPGFIGVCQRVGGRWIEV